MTVTQDYKKLRETTRKAIEAWYEDGLYGELNEDQQVQFQQMAELTGADIFSQTENTTMSITLNPVEFSLGMSEKEIQGYLDGCTVVVKGPDGRELDVESVIVENYGM